LQAEKPIKENNMEYTAVFEKMDNGWYFAQCEQMPNAVTQGKTLVEAKENLKEVIAMLMEVQKEQVLQQLAGKKLIRRRIAKVAML
jgi:predicted RNase H-like HicB family nuclease